MDPLTWQERRIYERNCLDYSNYQVPCRPPPTPNPGLRPCISSTMISKTLVKPLFLSDGCLRAVTHPAYPLPAYPCLIPQVYDRRGVPRWQKFVAWLVIMAVNYAFLVGTLSFGYHHRSGTKAEPQGPSGSVWVRSQWGPLGALGGVASLF